MQLTLGRRWILELRFSIALRQRMEAACMSVCPSVQRRKREKEWAQRWDRDAYRGRLLSSWTRDRDLR